MSIQEHIVEETRSMFHEDVSSTSHEFLQAKITIENKCLNKINKNKLTFQNQKKVYI